MRLRAFLTVTLGLVVLTAAMPTPERSSPAAVVNAFYAWYMKHSLFSDVAGAKPYFMATFYRDFATVVRAQDCTHSAIIDWDPFNGAQVGTAAYRVGTPTVSDSTASIPMHNTLVLGSRRFAGPPVTVVATREADGWRISDVVDQTGGSLEHILRGDLVTPHATASERECLAKPIP